MLVGNSTSTLGHARENLELNPGSCSWETFPQNSVMLVGMTGGHRFCPMKIPQFIREVAELGMQERAGEFQERDGEIMGRSMCRSLPNLDGGEKAD